MLTRETITAWLPMIPTEDDLRTIPRRIIMHWTGGNRSASELEKKHYHYLFEQDGDVVQGIDVDENMEHIDDNFYAAHTRGFNSYSAGVSFCGMAGATPGHNFGKYPLTEEQVDTGLAFIALLCYVWGLDPEDVNQLFTHYEAEAVHGVDQLPLGSGNWKWDITELQFLPDLDKDEVGPWLRAEVARHLEDIERIMSNGACGKCEPPVCACFGYRVAGE
jgi:hypothetical protein